MVLLALGYLLAGCPGEESVLVSHKRITASNSLINIVLGGLVAWNFPVLGPGSTSYRAGVGGLLS